MKGDSNVDFKATLAQRGKDRTKMEFRVLVHVGCFIIFIRTYYLYTQIFLARVEYCHIEFHKEAMSDGFMAHSCVFR